MNVSSLSRIDVPVYVGIDVHKKSYSLTAISAERLPVRKTMCADPAGLLAFLKKEFKGQRIFTAYEAGFSGFALHRALERAGFTSIVVHPGSIEVAVNNRVKTDKRDSAKIAQHLSHGRIKGIHVPTEEAEEARLLHRTREQLVEQKTQLYNQIKSRLHQFGLLRADEDFHANKKSVNEFVALVRKHSKNGCLVRALESLANVWRSVDEEIKEIERDMKFVQASAVKNREPVLSELFMVYETIPGIAFIGAQTLATELGDMTRFENERSLFSFLGLTPTEHSSGEAVRRGHITRQGSGRLRRILTQAAWKAVAKDIALKDCYERLKARRGSQKAIIAIARKLIGRVRACIRKKESYKLGYNGGRPA